MKINVFGVGDRFIPADVISDGLSVLNSYAHVQTIDWAMDNEAELQRINSIVEAQGSDAIQPPDYVFDMARDAEVFITQFCTVTRKLIDHCPRLKIIGVLRAGCENVNVDYASEKGILVMNTPGRNADAVADYTIGMMIAEVRNIAKGHMALKNGHWVRQYPNSSYIPDISGKTVGLIGFGQIGRKVARRLKGFDVRIFCYDPYVDVFPEEIEACSLETLMHTADFISIHVRSTPETAKLVSKEMIALMKSTAYLINTSRPTLIDTDALVAALQDKRIAGAAIDVFDTEPPGKDNPLVRLENITITPHMAGGSRDAFHLSPNKLALEMVKLWQADQTPRTIVNQDLYKKAMQGRTAFFKI